MRERTLQRGGAELVSTETTDREIRARIKKIRIRKQHRDAEVCADVAQGEEVNVLMVVSAAATTRAN